MKNLTPKALIFSSIAAVSLVSGSSARAADVTWNASSTSSAWSDSGNWTGGVPGNTSAGVTASTDTAIFNVAPTSGSGSALATPITIDSGRTIGGISFSGAIASYYIGSTSGDPLYLSSGGSIADTSSTSNQYIEAPLSLGGNYTFNDSATNSGLVIAGAVSASTGSTLTLTGTGAFADVTGTVGNTGSAISLLKTGSGTWTFNGSAASSYSGSTTIDAGKLNVDFSNFSGTPTNLIGSGALALGSTQSTSGPLAGTGVVPTVGTLIVKQKNGVATSQSFNGTAISSLGLSTLTATSVGGSSTATLTVNLGALTHTTGALLNISSLPTSGDGSITTTTGNVAGASSLGGWITIGNDVASSASTGGSVGAITVATYTANTWGSGLNTDVSGSFAGSGATGSLHFNNASANTITLANGSVITSGALVYGSGVAGNANLITGGSLAGSAGGELDIINKNGTAGGGLTIASNIVNNGSATALVVYTGGNSNGLTTLTGNNTYTGPTYVSGPSSSFLVLDSTSGYALNSNVYLYSGGIAYGANNQINPNAVLTADGGTFDLKGFNQTLGGLSSDPGYSGTTIQSTGTSGSGTTAGTNSFLTLDVAAGQTYLYAGKIYGGDGGTLNVVKTGAGTQKLANSTVPPSSYIINQGLLQFVIATGQAV